jgi:Reverse transcriptase (RNA-dependent DNA polymerase)
MAAPMVKEDKTRIERSRGTPQGGVVSPILSNLFLHYVFDLWMTRTHPDLPWCRYADDGLVHCRTEPEAQALKADLQARLAVCRLELHPTKTKIVYCKLTLIVRCLTNSSRVLCSINVACCSALLIGTKRIPGRDITSQIASASTGSFLPRLT